MFVGARMEIKALNITSKVNVTNSRSKDIRHMNVDRRTSAKKSLIAIAIVVKSMNMENMSVDPSLNRHLTRRPRYLSKVILMTGITIQGIVVTIIMNMDTFLRIA